MLLLRRLGFAAWLTICGCSTTTTETTATETKVTLSCDQLDESSGIAVSTRNPEILWSHNDSGDKPRLFAFTRQGKWIAEVKLRDTQASDWEDICSFQRDGKHFLAIGDVGDNSRARSSVDVYVIEEPKIDLDASKLQKESLSPTQRIRVKYPQGAVDCESLAYDSIRDEFLLASKETLRCRLMTFPAQPDSNATVVEAQIQHVLALPMTTAADISRDGQSLVIATYGPACLLPRGSDGRWDTRAGSLKMLELPMRPQGEAICFSPNGKSLLLTSEFSPTLLWTVALENE